MVGRRAGRGVAVVEAGGGGLAGLASSPGSPWGKAALLPPPPLGLKLAGLGMAGLNLGGGSARLAASSSSSALMAFPGRQWAAPCLEKVTPVRKRQKNRTHALPEKGWEAGYPHSSPYL